MSRVLDVVSALLMLAGSLFALVAAIGLVRSSDSYIRIHIATKPATLSVVLTFTAAILQLPGLEPDVQLALAVVLQFWTAPVASHMLGRAIQRSDSVDA